MHGKETAAFAAVKESDVAAVLAELGTELLQRRCGFVLKEVAGGFRFQSEPSCGKWLRHLLNTKPTRLSHPALETLAIIAYRQPMARPDIEAIRGVNVDHIIRMLMEMQMIKIVGRSELPGRPFLYGTTQAFLDHFGLRDLRDLKDIEPALLAAREQSVRRASAAAAPAAAPAPTPAAEPRVETPVAEEEDAVEKKEGEKPVKEPDEDIPDDEDLEDEDIDDEEDDEEDVEGEDDESRQ